MRIGRVLIAVGLVAAAGAAVVATVGPMSGKLDLKAVSNNQAITGQSNKKSNDLHFKLVPSPDAIKKCLPKAKVNVGGKELATDEKGQVKVDGLPPGPVEVSAMLVGYRKAEETASIVPNRITDLTVIMTPEKKRVPATITGLVRSAKGGTPIAADLELPQVKLKAKASAK